LDHDNFEQLLKEASAVLSRSKIAWFI
jgi:hypothetical protein